MKAHQRSKFLSMLNAGCFQELPEQEAFRTITSFPVNIQVFHPTLSDWLILKFRNVKHLNLDQTENQIDSWLKHFAS